MFSMSNHPIFRNPDQIYGYCACPIAVADEQITDNKSHHYHITVIQSGGCDPPMDNCVLLTTYEFCLDELVTFICDTDDVILSIKRITNEQQETQ